MCPPVCRYAKCTTSEDIETSKVVSLQTQGSLTQEYLSMGLSMGVGRGELSSCSGTNVYKSDPKAPQ